MTRDIKNEKMIDSALKNGTVIDHIPPQNLFKVIALLDLDQCTSQMTFGTNLNSKLLGKKAIIKIADLFLEDKDIDKIAMIAPTAKLNIIKDYQVVEKRALSIPDVVKGIVKCLNPKCITNNEEVPTVFEVVERQPLTLRCHYCEKTVGQEDIVLR